MKVLFLSLSDREELYKFTFPKISDYCNKYSYNFIYKNSIIDKHRHISWSKIPFLLEQMSINNNYDLYIWIDDDIYITNFSIDIVELIKEYKFNTILFSKDVTDECPLNAGIMICKNNINTIKILNSVYDLVDECGTRHKHNWEQDAFIKYYKTYMQNINDIITIPHRKIQSFYRTYLVPDHLHWQTGDFAAHVTGMDLPERLKIIKTLSNSLSIKG